MEQAVTSTDTQPEMTAESYLLSDGTLLFLANLAAASCLVGALGLLAARACRRASAPLRHGLLLAVPVLLLLSPLFSRPWMQRMPKSALPSDSR